MFPPFLMTMMEKKLPLRDAAMDEEAGRTCVTERSNGVLKGCRHQLNGCHQFEAFASRSGKSDRRFSTNL